MRYIYHHPTSGGIFFNKLLSNNTWLCWIHLAGFMSIVSMICNLISVRVDILITMVAGLFLFGLGPKSRLAAAENTRQKMIGINKGAGEKTG